MKKGFPYRAVVFAGGGNRCLWQVGFWRELEKHMKIRPEVISCVSAGAAMACMIQSGRIDEGLRFFTGLTGKNRKNAYFANLFGPEKVFPHYEMYRSALLHTIGQRELTRIHRGPEILVLVARPPRPLGPKSATFIGMGAYYLEKHFSSPVHPKLASKLGFVPEVVPVRNCGTPEELVDLIIASSCTPPFVPVMRLDGKIVLDGGLIDNVPVAALPEEYRSDALVLLTRKYSPDKIPAVPGRTYVQPSVPIPITKWDYTNPGGLKDAHDIGMRDARVHLNDIRSRKR